MATSWDAATLQTANGSLSGGNLTYLKSGPGDRAMRSVHSIVSGDYYSELLLNGSDDTFGLLNGTPTLPATTDFYPGLDNNGVCAVSDGRVVRGGVNQLAVGALGTQAVGQRICMAVRWKSGTGLVWFRIQNGNWNASGTANPATGTGGIDISALGTPGTTPLFLSTTTYVSGGGTTLRSAASEWAFVPPDGFAEFGPDGSEVVIRPERFDLPLTILDDFWSAQIEPIWYPVVLLDPDVLPDPVYPPASVFELGPEFDEWQWQPAVWSDVEISGGYTFDTPVNLSQSITLGSVTGTWTLNLANTINLSQSITLGSVTQTMTLAFGQTLYQGVILALQNYNDLKTEIIAKLGRGNDANFVARIPTFIGLAEAKLNRKLNTLEREFETNTTLTAGSSTITLPTDFDQMVGVQVVLGGFRMDLTQIDVLNAERWAQTTGVPEHYAIDGSLIYFDAKANVDYVVWYRYRQKFGLSDAVPQNWLILEEPDLYLAMCLAEAFEHIRNMDMAAYWRRMGEMYINDVNNNSVASRKLQPARLDIKPATSFNIFRGE